MTQPPDSSAPLVGAEARRAARNAGAIAAARLISSAALFGWQLVLARMLGDADFGVYSTISALFTIGATLAAFGMGMMVIRDVARRPERAGDYLTVTLVAQTLLALGAYAGINGAASALGYSEAIRAFTALAGLSLFADTLGNMAYDQLLAQERMVTTSIIETAHVLIRIALALLMLALGFGLLGVYAATIVSGFGRAAVLWRVLWRSGVRPRFPLDRPLTRLLLINSAPLALSAFINITYTQIDRLMTTSLLTEADTGHLGAAFVIVYGVIELLSTTILVAIFPMMSRAYAGGEESGSRPVFRFLVDKLSFFTLLAGLCLALIFTLFAADITVPLFGEDFRPSADVLRVLIWYCAATMVVNVFAQAMMVQNRQRQFLVIRTGGLIGKLALNLLLLPLIGVIGAAFASLTAELLVLLVVGARFGAGETLLQPGRLLRLGLASALTLLAMYAVGLLHPFLGIAAGIVVYPLSVLGLRVLAGDDLDLLYRLIAAMPGGRVILRFWRRDVALNW